MTNSRHALDIRKIVGIIVIGLGLSVLWFSYFQGSWSSPNTQISSFSLLAYLGIVCSAFILVEYRLQEISEQTVFHAPLLFFAVISMVRAIFAIFGERIQADSTSDILSLIFQLTLFAALVLHSTYRRAVRQPASRTREVFVLVFLAIFAQISFRYFRLIIPTGSAIILGTILGVSVGMIITLSGIIWARTQKTKTKFDADVFIPGFLIFGISWMPLVYGLHVPSEIWTLSLSMQAIGLSLLSIGTAIPFIVKSGSSKRYAAQMAIGIQFVAILPLLIAQTATSIFTTNPFSGSAIHLIVHLGASVLALLFAILTAAYNSQRFHFKRYPIIAAFLIWSIVDGYQFLAHFLGYDILVNSIVPYATGTIFTLILLPLAIQWSNRPPSNVILQNRKRIVIALMIAVVTSILGGEILQELFIPSVVKGYVGRVIVLISILFVIFSFIFLLSVQLRQSPEKMNVDRISVGFLMPWIIPTLIRANYGELSVGWGFGDLILLLALLIGPSVLGVMYLREMSNARELERKASYYSDLLIHDISNCHQALELSIGLMESREVKDSVKKQALEDAQSELLRAERLIANVRGLAMAEELTYRTMQRVDIISSIVSAYNIAKRNYEIRHQNLTIIGQPGDYFALASNLLLDALVNLFDIDLAHSPEGKTNVFIQDSIEYGKLYWDIGIEVLDWQIEPDVAERAFEIDDIKDFSTRELGLTVVRNLINAIGGMIKASPTAEGTMFTITLRKA